MNFFCSSENIGRAVNKKKENWQTIVGGVFFPFHERLRECFEFPVLLNGWRANGAYSKRTLLSFFFCVCVCVCAIVRVFYFLRSRDRDRAFPSRVLGEFELL